MFNAITNPDCIFKKSATQPEPHLGEGKKRRREDMYVLVHVMIIYVMITHAIIQQISVSSLKSSMNITHHMHGMHELTLYECEHDHKRNEIDWHKTA